MIKSIDISSNLKLTSSPTFAYSLLKEAKQISNYWHEKRTMGGDWAAGFEVLGEPEFLKNIFEIGLLAKVRSWSDGGAQSWGGYISSMTLETPFGPKTRDINQLANNVWSRYQTSSGVGADIGNTVQEYDAENLARMQSEADKASATRGTVYTNQSSIDRYGQHDYVISCGTSAAAVANQVAQMHLAEYGRISQRLTSIKFDEGKTEKFRLLVKCEGSAQSLNWRVFNEASASGTRNASVEIATIIMDGTYGIGFLVESVQFPDGANTTQVEACRDADRKALDQIFDIARLGDSSLNRWIFYTIDDIGYFAMAALSDPSNLRYIGRFVDGKLQVMASGQILYPKELVQPNNFIKMEGQVDYQVVQPDLDIDESVAFIEGLIYRDDSDNLDISGTRAGMLDVAMTRLGIGNNSML